MLANFELYIDEVNQYIRKHQYDPYYMYYFPGPSTYVFESEESNYNNHRFVSIDTEGNINGFIIYTIDHLVKKAYDLSIFGFKYLTSYNAEMFANDVREAVDNIFNKFQLNKLSWFCIEDNEKALETYRAFIKYYGGIEIGCLKDEVICLDHRVRDVYLFEITRQEYKRIKPIEDKKKSEYVYDPVKELDLKE